MFGAVFQQTLDAVRFTHAAQTRLLYTPWQNAAKDRYCGPVEFTPDGRLLLMTERTSNSVSAFAVDAASGALTFLDNYAIEEQQPRNISFSPSGKWLLTTGEKANRIGVYAIGEKGALTRVSEAPSGKGALWIETLQLK